MIRWLLSRRGRGSVSVIPHHVRPLGHDLNPDPDVPAPRTRDFRLLLATRVIRAFGFGFSAVLLGIELELRHVPAQQIGLTLGVGVLASALFGLPIAALAARFGRRRMLSVTGVMMAVTGLDLALATNSWLLSLSGVTGMLGAAGVDLGPFLPIEQAILAQSVPPARRNIAFGRYSLTGGLATAAGGFATAAAGGPGQVHAFFFLYTVLGLATTALPMFMTERVESSAGPVILRRNNMRPLIGLTALFSIDSLGGGFLVQAIIAYWLHVRFAAGSEVLGQALGYMAVVQALSYEAAARLAGRIGLINTMVFTHLPSSVITIFVPFSPNLTIATILLVVRFSMGSMDVPARQAYVVSIVPPTERAAAVALTGSVRGVAQALGPVLAGWAIQSAAFGVPFFVGGALKIIYDVSLYIAYRRRPADHETATAP